MGGQREGRREQGDGGRGNKGRERRREGGSKVMVGEGTRGGRERREGAR